MAAPDLSEFHKLSKPKKKPCPVSVALAELAPKSDDGERLTAALATDPGIITHVGIQKWLEARGIEVRWQGIASHRRGACGCSDD